MLKISEYIQIGKLLKIELYIKRNPIKKIRQTLKKT